jgi:plastocyanin
MRKASVLLVALALALSGLAACGGDDGDDGDDEEITAAEETTTTEPAGGGGGAGGGGPPLQLSSPADSSLAYDKDSLQAPAGSVTIDYDNPAPLNHDVVIEDQSGEDVGKTELIAEDTTSITLDLQPGTYTFYCDVPGHREGGMEGTLTVN